MFISEKYDSIADFDERTTVTISTKTQAALKNTNKFITENMKLLGDNQAITEYAQAYKDLQQITTEFQTTDDLDDRAIDRWNQQIELVNRLGAEVTNLIKAEQTGKNLKSDFERLKSIAKEMGSRNIRANCIAPGFIITDMTNQIPEEAREEWMKTIPLRRGGTPEDVADTALFLASDLSRYVTGQTIHCCGGMNC